MGHERAYQKLVEESKELRRYICNFKTGPGNTKSGFRVPSKVGVDLIGVNA